MSYLPKIGKQEELENLVSKRVDEILSSVKGVSSMYIEPGDVMLVTVSGETEPRTMHELKKVFSKIFNENKGVFLAEDIKVEVIKQGDVSDLTQTSSEISSLKSEVESLRKELDKLKSQIKTK